MSRTRAALPTDWREFARPGLPLALIGWIALRTKSLLLPIAWHVALDLPLYAYLACRAS